MRIAHLSDLHIDSKADVIYGVSPKENLSRAVSLLKKIPDIDVGIVTGDITNDGEYESLVKADELLSPLGFPIYVLAGNHDNVEIVKRLADPIRKMQAKGSFKMSFERYEEVPQMIAAKIIEAHKADLADDED